MTALPTAPPRLTGTRLGLLAILVVGCAAPPVPQPGVVETPSPPRAAPRDAAGAPAVVAPAPPPPAPVPTTTFRPSRPGADRYEQTRPAARANGLARDLAVAVTKSSPRGHVVLHDGALDAVAADLARVSDAPTFELLQFLLGHYGIFESEPLVLRYAVAKGGDRALLARARGEIRTALAARGWNRFGVGVAHEAGQTSAVVAFDEQDAKLAPVPRAVTSDGAVTLRGQLARELHDPELVVTTARGRIERPVLERSAGGAFVGEVRCADGDGRYQVELAAHGARGLRVVANIAIHCGVDPPTELAVPVERELAPEDLPGAERQLLDLVNAERARAGAPPLQWDERLADVARAHSRDMAEEGRVAHVSPRTGGPADRVARAGLRPVLAAENVGTGPGVLAIHRAMMASPVHRVNVLDPGFVSAGIGLARGHAVDGAAAPLFVTQLFAKWK